MINNIVYAIATAPDGSVWVGTRTGAGRFDGVAWTSHTVADGLVADPIWYVDVTSDGDVWFSTHTGGVSRYSPDQDTWATFGVGQGLLLPNARFLTVGPDGMPWLHIGYDHIYRFNGTSWQLAYEAEGQWVCDITFAADGSPFIATCGGYHAYGTGLAHLEEDTWEYITANDGLVGNDVSAVVIAQDGTIAGVSRPRIDLTRVQIGRIRS